MKHLIKITTLIFVFSIIPVFASANTTGYAWSESVGWFDFSPAVVSDTAVTGYAYNDNTGWLVLSNITNTNGILSGYAWSESVGWFDFSDVIITNDTFSGYAYNDNTGWLNFTDTTVTTTWAPPADTPAPTRRSSGGSVRKPPTLTPITPPVLPSALPTTLPTTVPELQTLLTQLQQQLQQLLSNTPASNNNPVSNNTNPIFTRDLRADMEGEDVRQLQILLNSKGYSINTPPLPGAPGYESTYFGNKTRDALIKYQQDNNITPAVGYFGPLTRGMMTQ